MDRSSVGSALIRSLHLVTRRPNERWLLVGIVLSAFASVGMGETPSPVNTGIEGVISVSPSHPGPKRVGVSDVAPAPNLRFTVKSGDSTVGAFITDPEGRFRIQLAPGHYVVMRTDSGAGIGHWRFETDVAATGMTRVQWTGDSGMR
jgi:hypothetical protein